MVSDAGSLAVADRTLAGRFDMAPPTSSGVFRTVRRMHIVVHDYSGHPFQLQLSRRLAKNGHRIHHLYCASVTGAKGNLTKQEDGAGELSISGLTMGRPVDKAHFVRRFIDERRYGRLAAGRISKIGPDLVLCANTPLDALRPIQKSCRKKHIKFVNWLQDINSLAAAEILPKKIPVLGNLIAGRYRALERRLLHGADHIISISDDFDTFLECIGIASGGYTTIENWAPLDEMPMKPRRNGWAERHGLVSGRNILYSGNLGFKQNPVLLIDLARAMGEACPDDRLIVVSEGMGADWLARRRAELGLPNLLLLPFQPYAEVPDMMASADVLLAILEPQDQAYCVPSKVLSYCCAGRAIVLSADAANLASRILSRNRCGQVVEAGDSAAFTRAVLDMLADDERRIICGANARRLAETQFDIEAIAARFEGVFADVTAPG